MIEFIIGAAFIYAIGFVQVYRERKEHFARTGMEGNPLVFMEIYHDRS